MLSLPTSDVLATNHDRSPAEDRQLVIIRVEDEDGAHGWGECSALNRPTYTAEWAEGAFELLVSGNPDRTTFPMAAAGLEMAYTDLQLRRDGTSLADSVGVEQRTVPAGVAVGLAPLPDLVTLVDQLVDAGFGRVKMKIVPGHDLEPVAAVISRHPDLELHVDANGSYLAEHQDVLRELASSGVAVIEQPFGPGDVAAAAELIDSIGPNTRVLADEAVGAIDDARRLFKAGALGGIAIKPARIGGLTAAVELLDWCVSNGVPASAGGMLESGLGRHALAAFAALPGCVITGDLSPSRRWLDADPWPDLAMVETSILVPTGPGVSPEPDPEVLDRFTVRSERRRVNG